MSKELADIVVMIACSLAGVLMTIMLFEIRTLRQEVKDLARDVAKIQGTLAARRGGDWDGDDRRE